MSIKTPNTKINLINNRIKYGTDGGINVDSNALFVNATTGRVGINTTNPTTLLDISGSIKSSSITDYSNSTGNNTQILTNVNGQNIWSYPGYNFNGADMFPVNTGDVLGPSLPAGSWSGVNCLGPDGKIYCSPRGGSPVYVFNPYDNTLETIPNATGDFIGMSAAPNGKIYFAPAASTFVGILDPFTRTWDNTSITSSQYPDLAYTGGNGKFWRCRFAPNGKIFMAPRSANYIGVVDTTNNTYSSIDISSVVPSLGGFNYNQSAVAKNGFLYMFPFINSYPILKINPNTNTFTTISQVFPITSYLGRCYWS